MTISAQVEEALELLQNRRQIALKSKKSGEFAYGQVCAYNECIAVLKDLKKNMEDTKKQTKNQNNKIKEVLSIINPTDDCAEKGIQIV